MAEELSRISQVSATDKAFELGITGIDEPFVGVIDLVAELDSKKTVVDFKASGSSYAEHEAQLSDQLTTYQLAEPDAERMPGLSPRDTQRVIPNQVFGRRTGCSRSAQVDSLKRSRERGGLAHLAAEGRDFAHLALCEEHGFLLLRDMARAIMGWAQAQLGSAAEGVALIRPGIAGLVEIGARASITITLRV